MAGCQHTTSSSVEWSERVCLQVRRRVVHRGTEARSPQETEERCGSDRVTRESGQRGGRAGNLGDRVDDEDARARSPGVHLVRVFEVEYSAQFINRGLLGGEGQQDSVRALLGPTIQEKTSAVCGSSDVSLCGGEKSETTV